MLYTIYLAQQIIALIEFETALFSRRGRGCPGDELCRSQPDSLAVPPLSVPSPPCCPPSGGPGSWGSGALWGRGGLGSPPLQPLCLLPAFLPSPGDALSVCSWGTERGPPALRLRGDPGPLSPAGGQTLGAAGGGDLSRASDGFPACRPVIVAVGSHSPHGAHGPGGAPLSAGPGRGLGGSGPVAGLVPRPHWAPVP